MTLGLIWDDRTGMCLGKWVLLFKVVLFHRFSHMLITWICIAFVRGHAQCLFAWSVGPISNKFRLNCNLYESYIEKSKWLYSLSWIKFRRIKGLLWGSHKRVWMCHIGCYERHLQGSRQMTKESVMGVMKMGPDEPYSLGWTLLLERSEYAIPSVVSIIVERSRCGYNVLGA